MTSPKDPGSDERKAETPEPIRYTQLYEASSKVYTRRIAGYFQRLRRYTGIPLLLGFFVLPWIRLDGRPAVWFDLASHQYHVLYLTFWPQDFMFLAWTLILAAFLLFAVTVTVGRVWCGFTCPQTVWTLMFIWLEDLCEGDRNQRIKLDKAPWTARKVLRKGAKHALWLALAFATGATFIGYFVPIRDLLMNLWPSWDGLYPVWSIPVAAVVFTGLFTLLTYLNAGWLREQVCKYMCPYARFQGVMYDKDTVYVQYDAKRGENRGARKSGEDYKAQGLGDCVDCRWCVQVCPVDIDIRDGSQYECINCGLCVDACDSIMDKMEYPKGLIRFTSEDALQTGKTRWWRPRLIGYWLAAAIMLGFFTYGLILRQPVGLDVLRDRGARLYRLQGEDVSNVYTLAIRNMDQSPHRYRLTVEGDLPFKIDHFKAMTLEPGEILSSPVRIVVNRSALKAASYPITLSIVAEDDDQLVAREETVFIGPDTPDTPD
jgi:cytochrome c oxidase accessory protein FixG